MPESFSTKTENSCKDKGCGQNSAHLSSIFSFDALKMTVRLTRSLQLSDETCEAQHIQTICLFQSYLADAECFTMCTHLAAFNLQIMLFPVI